MAIPATKAAAAAKSTTQQPREPAAPKCNMVVPGTRMDYIHEMALCLADMAAQEQQDVLSYLLKLAALEARQYMEEFVEKTPADNR